MLRNSRLAKEGLLRSSAGQRPKGWGRKSILVLSALLLLILFLVILLPRSWRSKNEDPYAPLLQRLAKLEEKMAGMEALEKKMNRIEEQNTKVSISIMDRVDRLEKSMIFKMGHMEKTQEQKAGPTPPASQRADQGQEKPVYHVVKPGENLYRIGLKYGLSTDEMRRLNQLAPHSVIQVGQKLIVGKGGQN